MKVPGAILWLGLAAVIIGILWALGIFNREETAAAPAGSTPGTDGESTAGPGLLTGVRSVFFPGPAKGQSLNDWILERNKQQWK